MRDGREQGFDSIHTTLFSHRRVCGRGNGLPAPKREIGQGRWELFPAGGRVWVADPPNWHTGVCWRSLLGFVRCGTPPRCTLPAAFSLLPTPALAAGATTTLSSPQRGGHPHLHGVWPERRREHPLSQGACRPSSAAKQRSIEGRTETDCGARLEGKAVAGGWEGPRDAGACTIWPLPASGSSLKLTSHGVADGG